ncbi:MAG: hypothetical protein ACR2P9_02350 [Gammaproteobacteria bacterium]
MTLLNDTDIEEVGGITPEQKKKIDDFLQGAAYCWCNLKKDEWFALRNLVGGENHFWQGTPLIVLYDKHNGIADDPVKNAGIDAGWLFKAMLHADKRKFETKREHVRMYKWIKDESVED